MKAFWNNINKFPRFLIGVLIGFFLTTFYPVFKSLNNKKQLVLVSVLILTILYCTYIVLRLMLDIN